MKSMKVKWPKALGRSPLPINQLAIPYSSATVFHPEYTNLLDPPDSTSQAFHQDFQAYPSGGERHEAHSAWYIWSALDSIQPAQEN